ncbi:hypothetical protein BOTBODRAFT_494107 [Botryobasidium botryosum FD-172 SS1]|uniref:Isoleucine--tRNA ligase, mitochondrial n=1 Tax=Botryobasidium botryosum (strain FD-172 SS1) TaxID=930990 RepID=A0A067M489_BOTB1|nr:hypothetical protein BOTBODRAFT_494107 [Botryobasidium botryosum FD-172 SS1]
MRARLCRVVKDPRRASFTRARLASTSAAKDQSKAYAASLLLPKTNFPLWSDPSKSEEPFRNKTCDKLYRWQAENATGPVYTLHDGPPYANGSLHMGHAMNKILKDIINRFQVLQGRRVDYIPGWDCHGLPIENKAIQGLKADLQTLAPGKIQAAAKRTAEREMEIQKSEFLQFGIMADWTKEGTYRTMDHNYEIRQLRIFREMVKQGLIYRHYRPVHWSPSSLSALAEAELVYRDDHQSRSVYVKFDVCSSDMSPALREAVQSVNGSNVKLLIWTTTPWTLPANMAIAVHVDLDYCLARPKETGEIYVIAQERLEPLRALTGELEVLATIRGSDLIGTTYDHLFRPSTSPSPRIIGAHYVSADSGTGLVHTAPAHGADDYSSFRALGQTSMPCPVDAQGHFTEEVVTLAKEKALGERLLGKFVLGAGTREVIDILKERGYLLAEQKIKHRYPYDWKTDKPIIVRATSQWFANLDKIKSVALSALANVKFHPESSRTRLESFIRERSEWCISRQRVWGVPIPALHDVQTDEATLTPESLDHIISVLEAKSTAHWWDGPVEDFLTPALRDSGRTFRKGTDTIDVWFDSGTSWSLLSNESTSDGPRTIADVCLEGSDQHRGWFQSLLLTAIGSAPEGKQIAPYKTLITHGFVLDQEGKKMSKSLGNVISPLTIINGGKDRKKEPAYGADVLRLWVATVEYGRDVSIGPTALAQAAESLRKIRNSARFMLGNIGGLSTQPIAVVQRENMGLADRYVMHQLYQLESLARAEYATFNFHRVVQALTTFANTTLSSLYLDISKDSLYADPTTSVERAAIVTVMNEALSTMTTVMAPILPHLAEEIAHVRKGDADPSEGLSVFTQPWRPVDEQWNDPQADHDMRLLLTVRSTVLELLEKARRSKNLRSSLEAEVEIVVPVNVSSDLSRLLREQQSFLKTLFIVSDVSIVPEAPHGDSTDLGWSFDDALEDVTTGATTEPLRIVVRPSQRQKCPRCWQWTRPEVDDLCGRCSTVVSS